MADCNYCTLQGFKKMAARAGGAVVLEPNPYPGLGPDGVDVFIHYPDDAEPTWAAWFMLLTDHCVCRFG